MQAHDVSERLTRVVLGLDGFYRESAAGSEPELDREGLVPVHWSPLEPLEIASWAEGRRRLHDLIDDAATLPDPWSRDWLTEYALSVSTLVRWLSGEDVGYEQVVAGAVRVDPTPPSRHALDDLRARRGRALRDAGYGSFAAYHEAGLVDAGEVEGVMTSLIAEAETRTRARMPGLELPSEPIGVKAVRGTPFSAYCDYPGKAVWINTDIPHTRAALKQLVAHEAYPGHYAHMGHRDALVRRAAMLPDAALVVTNTASSVLFEGIAERGLDLLGWRDDGDDQVAWWHNRLQWLCSIEVAHGLNTGRLTPAAAAAFLRATCDADEAWIEGKLRFVTHALRAPFVYTYWWGGTVVGAWWQRVAARRHDAAVAYLYARMHSPSTLEAHWVEEEN